MRPEESKSRQTSPEDARPDSFDVFLSYNGKDREQVRSVAQRLREARLVPWFDQWALTPGGQYQEELFAGLHASAACAYFVGPHGEGDWSRMELDVARSRAAKERDFRLFPVLLPGLPEPFDRTTLPPFLSQRTWVDLRPGVGNADAIQALINAIKGVPTGLPSPVTDDARPPYRGLLAFGEEDASLFFGRDAEIQRLVEKLRGNRFLAVLGPSGSGKSSLVRAGLVNALRDGQVAGSEEWPIIVTRPGALPLTTLATEVAERSKRSLVAVLDELAADERSLHLDTESVLLGKPQDARACWVVDQFEELFTVCRSDDERVAFIKNLVFAAAIPGGRTAVIITLRADFYPRLAAYPDLAALVTESQFLVSPLDHDGLRAAIVEPARRVGLQFEEGLVDTILADVADRPGVLPLLEHALLELWHRRRGNLLTLEGYRASGGVEASLAKRAEETYASFSPEEQELVRRALLRLTEPGQGTEDARRRATIRELIGSPTETDAVQSVINRLADTRLVTVSQGTDALDATVDLSHEALIRGWPRMRAWIEDDREALRTRGRIADATADWMRLGREDEALLRGARLLEATEFEAQSPELLNADERTFVQASRAVAQREAAAAERRRRRLLMTAGGLAVFFLVLSLAALAFWLRSEGALTDAQTSRLQAEQLRDEALSRRLVTQSVKAGTELDLSLLMAVQALDRAPTPLAEEDAKQNLLAILGRRSGVFRLLHGWPVAFGPGGLTAVLVGDDASVTAWDVRTGVPLAWQLPAWEGSVISYPGEATVSPDGTSVAYPIDGGVAIADLRTGGVRLRPPAEVARLAVLPPPSAVPPPPDDWTSRRYVAWSDDQQSVISARVGASGATVERWDLASNTVSVSTWSGQPGPVEPALSPDGRYLAGLGDQLMDTSDGTFLGPLIAFGGTDSYPAPAFSRDSQFVAMMAVPGDDVIQPSDPPSSPAVLPSDTPPPVGPPDIPPPGSTPGIGPPGPPANAGSPVAGSKVFQSASTGTNSALPLADAREEVPSIHVYMLPGLEAVAEVPNSSDALAVALSPDGGRIAISGIDGTVTVRDVDSGQIVVQEFASTGASVETIEWDSAGARLALGADRLRPVTAITNVVPTPRLLAAQQPIPLYEGYLGDLSVRTNRAVVASVTDLPGIQLSFIDILESLELGTYVDQQSQVSAVSLEADGAGILYSTPDEILGWQPGAQPSIAEVPASDFVTGIAASRDGHSHAISNANGESFINVIREDGAPMTIAAGGPGLAFSPNGDRLAVASAFDFGRVNSAALSLFDLADGRLIASTPLPGDGVDVAFSDDGTRIAVVVDEPDLSTSPEETAGVLLYEFDGLTLLGYVARGDYLAVDFDGNEIVTLADGSVDRWAADSAVWRAMACDLAGRDLSPEEWLQYVGTTEQTPTCAQPGS